MVTEQEINAIFRSIKFSIAKFCDTLKQVANPLCNNNEVNPVLVKNICCKYKVSKKSKLSKYLI